MRYIPHTSQDIEEMLTAVGVDSVNDLFAVIPDECRLDRALDLPEPLNEWELTANVQDLAAKNGTTAHGASFLGAGCYDHYVPAVVKTLMSRAEFVTAYTPYQPESSQGTLQAIYEYQTLVARLLGMDVANASMYDGASALAEAVLMALRIKGGGVVAVSRAVQPQYRDVVATYLEPGGFGVVELPVASDGRTDLSALSGIDKPAAVVVQSPNFFGCIEDLKAVARAAHKCDALCITSFTEPLAWGILKNPGGFGADIVCGEGRSFGLSRYGGGMSLGMFAAKREFVRSMPGRLVGKTVDREGQRGFVLTLSTREQHIRREKATSNICSNQSLCALGAAIYMACLGKTGIRELARINVNKAAYLKDQLTSAGCEIPFSAPTFNEFIVRYPAVFDLAAHPDFTLGIPLGRWYPELADCHLVCATETASKHTMDSLAGEVAACRKR